MIIKISEFFGENRRADVLRLNESTNYLVVCYENNIIVQAYKFIGDKSLHYVEDAAENWTLYIPE